ncbi:MAG: aminopeptidase [Bacteroidetes bacterium]|nr:MAG: aminopeptidase [Bacteroidota bacterium]
MTDEKFTLGIKNAVQVCMNITRSDKVFVITDLRTLPIGKALISESNKMKAQTRMVKLEEYGVRPMTEVPPALIKEMVDFKPTVTYFAANGQEGEVKMRMALDIEMQRAFTDLGLPHPRHGHMIGITPRLIREGMTADYIEVNRLTLEVLELVKEAKTIKVTSQKGTDLTATFTPDYNWIPCHGLYHSAGDWGNLPEGEVFTCPETLNGTIVADVLGDYFSSKYGVLNSPIIIKVKDGIVQGVSCQDHAIADEFMAYLKSSENGLRVGEFAIGTNTSVTELSGHLLQDEKIPGIHIAFGNPIGYETGADWTSDVHVDVVPVNCTIRVDDKLIMENGIFSL